MLEKLPSTCGYKAALVVSAAASALRVRAAAMLSVGAPASASFISASSCGSLNAFHQLVLGHAAVETAAPSSARCVARPLTSRIDAVGAIPFTLAQAATKAVAAKAKARRRELAVTRRAIGNLDERYLLKLLMPRLLSI